jgi:hypothetical protein
MRVLGEQQRTEGEVNLREVMKEAGREWSSNQIQEREGRHRLLPAA